MAMMSLFIDACQKVLDHDYPIKEE
jgi:hypothetical protein